MELLHLQVLFKLLLPSAQASTGGLQVLFALFLLGPDLLEPFLCLEETLSVVSQPHRILDHRELLLWGYHTECIPQALMHYNKHIIRIQTQSAERFCHFYLARFLEINFKPVGSILSYVSGQVYEVRPEWEWPLTAPWRIVEEQRHPGNILPPFDQIAEPSRPLCVRLSQCDRNSQKDA